jgi:hypothetical protein
LGGTSAETPVAARKINNLENVHRVRDAADVRPGLSHHEPGNFLFSQSQESGVAGPPQPSIRVISVQTTRVDVMGHGGIVFSGSPHVLKANADVRLRWLEASGAASSSEQG